MSNTLNPYDVDTRLIDGEIKYYVSGPDDNGFFGYYGGSLYASRYLDTQEQAELAVKIANTAYRLGYTTAQREIRLALGLKD